MNEHNSNDDPQQRELLRVCRIGRAQGLKGEVNVMAFTDEPERRFAPGSVLSTADGREFTVIRSRSFKLRWIVLFKGVEDRNAAEALNGLELFCEADDAETMADEDAWYPSDLIGLQARLVDGNALGFPEGTSVGTVSDVLEGAAQSILEITSQSADGDVLTSLVPFVDEIVPEVFLEEGYLTLDPPGGLIPDPQALE
ncbi:ribosome maturation factor RimM [Bifidobacterium crudilactis]|uniref:ribosome maturation factor RimM n=1 Tax=Bifidobacterium crudilactis TaxID=327277 RepID=UPI002649EA58|nr:ribosome maturation factor RimM [Bifidobacterium crudilactis]MDN5971741.1 ribosome maturation factor RimM [Bifidobacterium crudilactis]MDN6000227.1 ribosome maturation factor RimM [Bifidobacterium crudilactis]MDN6209815.1 ribosome maturation factor RimM [Bifidobacterium crudilactis]MDN6233982.1 ribosome maturation factor RimM [Bifidobacterium crudilactis]MDN6271397.1 ribosome maturation factor RimM [Bifidobacterium crudilactis]